MDFVMIVVLLIIGTVLGFFLLKEKESTWDDEHDPYFKDYDDFSRKL